MIYSFINWLIYNELLKYRYFKYVSAKFFISREPISSVFIFDY